MQNPIKYLQYLKTFLLLILLSSTGCSSYVLNLTDAETVEKGEIEISGAGVPGIQIASKEFVPSIGLFAAYGLTQDVEIKIGGSVYTEVLGSRNQSGQDRRVYLDTGFGYGIGAGTKIRLPNNELMAALGFSRGLDWALDLPVAYFSENSYIGEGIIFAPAIIGTMSVDEGSSYSFVYRINSVYSFEEYVSRFSRSSLSIGTTRYLNDHLILRFNVTADIFRLLDGYIVPGFGMSYRI